MNALLYGSLYGPIALPWSGPLLMSIFAHSLTMQEAVSKLLILLWFGIGFALPLLAILLISGGAQRWITYQFAVRARLFNVLGGLLLVRVGLYAFRANFELLRLFLRTQACGRSQ